MRLHSIFLHYLISTRPLGYFLVFIGMIFEGDIILFTSFFLTHQGFFDLGDMIITIIAGAFLGDMSWFWIGAKLKNTSSIISRWTEKLTKPLEKHLEDRPMHTIFISKFVYGIHHAVLIRAGMVKMSVKEFLKIDLPAVFLWVLVIGGFGFFSSASLAAIRHYIRFAEVSLLIGLIFFLFVWGILARKIKKLL